jgi:hypothetical protein
MKWCSTAQHTQATCIVSHIYSSCFERPGLWMNSQSKPTSTVGNEFKAFKCEISLDSSWLPHFCFLFQDVHVACLHNSTECLLGHFHNFPNVLWIPENVTKLFKCSSQNYKADTIFCTRSNCNSYLSFFPRNIQFFQNIFHSFISLFFFICQKF